MNYLTMLNLVRIEFQAQLEGKEVRMRRHFFLLIFETGIFCMSLDVLELTL